MNCFLLNSSLGKKLVMSISGCALVLFLLFHMAMNLVALVSADAYNMVCAFLGANWYAVVATVGLAALVVLHFVYAFILTVNNYKARGSQRYAVTVNEPGVEWASKNMLVLGIIVILGLGLHLVHFWSKMMLVELMGSEITQIGDEIVHATDGAAIIAFTFSKWYNVALYLVWLVALWFHLNHGVWSMFQTAGFANDKWYPRLKCASKLVSTLIVLGFAAVIITFFAYHICGGCAEACCSEAAQACTEACCAGHAH